MSYNETIKWLFNQFPDYQTKGESAYKPSLDNVLLLCKYLNINYNKLSFIHVAGTNGKGTVCHFLDSIFQEAGYKTGLFTSPHIVDFTERIRVSGKKISQFYVEQFCKKIKLLNLSFNPSFFEISWVMALDYFIKQKCRICIIETGLGGRLDSTNIINPIISVITSISKDHENILGKKYSDIAFEKAGIIKKNIPVFVGNMKANCLKIIKQKAVENNSLLIDSNRYSNNLKSMFPRDTFLYKNEILVRTICDYLEELKLYNLNEFVNLGILNARKNNGYIARFQLVQENPKIIIDVAHNEDGVKNLLKWIKKIKFDKLIIIYGASKDKDWKKIIELFPLEAKICITEFDNPRSLNIDEVQLKLNNLKNMNYFKNIVDSLNYAKSIQNETDIILICGSFFLISDFFKYFYKNSLNC